MESITLTQAQQIVMAALEKATDIDVKMNIAIVDAGANLIAFARQEGAWLGSIDIAIKKAKTARFFDMPSADLGKMSQPKEPLYGIEITNDGLVSFGGGFPIKDAAGNVIGAIGVSGGQVKQDEQVANAGLDALKA
ncbi:MAG TPA: heme-binding protein [Daejeonella sp.]